MESLIVTLEGDDIDQANRELHALLIGKDINIDVKPSELRFGRLSLDPTSLIVSGASVLSALITALLAYLANRRDGTIIISGKSGRKIEIPKDTPNEKIEYFVLLAKELDAEQIKVSVRRKKV